MKTLECCLAIFLSFTSSQRAFAQDWELSKEKNDITVYTRENPDSPIKEFKAITILESSPDQILDVILNFESYQEWYDHCKKAELVSKKSNNRYITYMEYQMPFPFSNRDAVNEMEVSNDNETILVTSKHKSGVVEEKDGLVRMPVSEGSWKLIPIEGNQTKVEHQGKGDPAGSIPGGIVNMFLVAGPINTLTQLKEYLEESK